MGDMWILNTLFQYDDIQKPTNYIYNQLMNIENLIKISYSSLQTLMNDPNIQFNMLYF